MRNERRKDCADVVMHDKISEIVAIGRITIDNYELCTVSFRQQWNASGGPNHER